MLLSGDFGDYLAYFRAWADADSDVKFFFFGGAEFGMDHSAGDPEFDFPLVWLQSPVIHPSKNDAGQYWDAYKTGVSFISKIDIGDNADYHAKLTEMYRLMSRFRAQLVKDNKNKGFLDMESQMEIGEIDRGWSGHFCGWRLEFNVLLNANAYVNAG
jgi:hypothetical protein